MPAGLFLKFWCCIFLCPLHVKEVTVSYLHVVSAAGFSGLNDFHSYLTYHINASGKEPISSPDSIKHGQWDHESHHTGLSIEPDSGLKRRGEGDSCLLQNLEIAKELLFCPSHTIKFTAVLPSILPQWFPQPSFFLCTATEQVTRYKQHLVSPEKGTFAIFSL